MLLNTVPLGVINAFVMQACYAMFYGIGPMYASYIGLSVLQITFFMSAFIVGGLLSQTPFGLLSDRIDRRIVIAICAAGGTTAAILLAQLGAGNALLIYLVVAVLGAFILPLYSLGMAHTNDYLEKDQMVGATGAIIKIGGAGSIIGAPAVAALMQFGAINYFFLLLGGLTAFVGCYALYRITRRAKAEEQLHSNFAILAPSQTSDELLTSMAEEAPDEEDDTEEEVDGTAVLKR
jgi:MFS family permease